LSFKAREGLDPTNEQPLGIPNLASNRSKSDFLIQFPENLLKPDFECMDARWLFYYIIFIYLDET
jgi:hypothetical protein